MAKPSQSSAIPMPVKKRILVEPLPVQGHFNSMLRLANCLRGSYEFIFIGPAEFAVKVSPLGFDFKIAETYLFTPAQLHLQQVGIINFLLERYFYPHPAFLHEIKDSAKKYDKLFDEIKPDMIWLDDHLALKSLFYAKYKTPAIIVVAALPAHKSSFVPPFQSMHVPEITTLSKWKINYEWKKISVYHKLNSLLSNFLTNGKTTRHIYQKYLNYSPTLKLDLSTSFNPVIKGLHYITTTPKALEFPFVNHFKVLYFSALLGEYASQPMDSRLEGFIRKANQMKEKDAAVRLIYVSLGTVTDQFKARCSRFYREIIKLATLENRYYFILSLGNSYDVLQNRNKTENVAVFRTVPQRTLLGYVDAMINHGGLNSVLECIQAGVPMLAYPLSTEWDQPGIAARIQYYGLGLSEAIRYATARAIQNMLLHLFSNYESYKSQLKLKRLEIEEENTTSLISVRHLVDDHFKQNTQLD